MSRLLVDIVVNIVFYIIFYTIYTKIYLKEIKQQWAEEVAEKVAEEIEGQEMKITTYRVPQLMSKMLTVICVDDRPICAVRGKKSTSDILARLNGYDTQIQDGRIQKIVDEEIEKATDR